MLLTNALVYAVYIGGKRHRVSVGFDKVPPHSFLSIGKSEVSCFHNVPLFEGKRPIRRHFRCRSANGQESVLLWRTPGMILRWRLSRCCCDRHGYDVDIELLSGSLVGDFPVVDGVVGRRREEMIGWRRCLDGTGSSVDDLATLGVRH